MEYRRLTVRVAALSTQYAREGEMSGAGTAGDAYELEYVEERYGSVLVRMCDGERISVDWGEPEDRTFERDFSGVVSELNRLAGLCAKHGIDISPKANIVHATGKQDSDLLWVSGWARFVDSCGDGSGAPDREQAKCNGTVVHSEYTACPRCDKR